MIQPAEQYLRGIKKLIVVAPTLESTPFESLITQLPVNLKSDDFSKLAYLNNRYQISYHYSATLWLKSLTLEKTEQRKSLDFLAFAPFSTGESKVFATTRGAGRDLPESGVEVTSIYNLFKNKQLKAEVSLAKTATKERFLQKANKARIVHIASHSEANTKNASLARVSFAGCGTTKNGSGCLLVGEVYNLELKADLLVLSSCASGVGKLTKGEGIFSLARSFLYVGAQNIVFSLWDIDDKYTRELMVAFYQQFLNQDNKQVSYQQALQTARKKMASKGVHPKHWAGIVMIGK